MRQPRQPGSQAAKHRQTLPSLCDLVHIWNSPLLLVCKHANRGNRLLGTGISFRWHADDRNHDLDCGSGSPEQPVGSANNLRGFAGCWISPAIASFTTSATSTSLKRPRPRNASIGGDPLVRSPCENQSYADTFRKPVFMKRQTRLGSAFGQFYKINHP